MRSFSTVLVATILAGCSQHPKYIKPELPTAPTYVGPAAGAGLRATDIAWRAFFRDPQLQALIERALVNNRDLRIAVLRIDEARGQYRIQRAERLPFVAVDAGASRIRTSGEVGPEPSDTTNRFEIGASVDSFELDFWGRLRSLSESARASYLSTTHARRAFQIILVADVAKTYLSDREYEERIALADRAVASRTRALDIGRLRLKAGVTSGLDYRQIETLLTQAITQRTNFQLQRARNRNTLEFLLGGSAADGLPAPLPLSQQGIVENIAPGLPSELLANRPDILEAEELLRAANADVGAARAARFPRISLTGAFGFASSALTSLISGGTMTASLGGNVAYSLFDGERSVANVGIANARLGIAVAAYERTIQSGFREVSDGLVARRWLIERMASQQRELEAQRMRANLATLRYRNGVSGYLEVLDAERDLFAAEQQTVLTRREQLTNAVDLYVALGGGVDTARG